MRKIIAYKNEHGAALIGALLLVVLVGASLVLRQLSRADLDAAREQTTYIALNTAKEALIAYATTSNNPGRLPCPEDTSRIGFPTEGSQLSSCSNVAPTIGRLPWYSLKREKILDGYGEPLWYALSPGFRAAPINNGTPGQLTVDAQPGGYAAIIFSPGPALSTQLRSAITAGTPPLLASYLDGTNSNGDGVFASTSAAINDRLLGITSAEITTPIIRRVLAEVRGADTDTPPTYGLRKFYNANGSTFPLADTDADGAANAGATTGGLPYNDLTTVMEATANGWITSNNWFGVMTYQVLTTPNRAILTLGGISLTVLPCTTQPCP
jgi:type II secretory pathway pseudopilin PulG